MIYKRYQKFTKNGVEWTEWYRLKEGDEQEVKRLKKECRWQLKSSKLLNDYKYVESEA